MMQVDVDTSLSKTEAIIFRHRAWTILMPTRLASTYALQMVPLLASLIFINEFKYLGSIIYSSPTSDTDVENADVEKRTKAASSAFGALKNVLNSLAPLTCA